MLQSLDDLLGLIGRLYPEGTAPKPFLLLHGIKRVKAGEDAPMSAKWVAALVLLSWAGVIMGGRLISYV